MLVAIVLVVVPALLPRDVIESCEQTPNFLRRMMIVNETVCCVGTFSVTRECLFCRDEPKYRVVAEACWMEEKSVMPEPHSNRTIAFAAASAGASVHLLRFLLVTCGCGDEVTTWFAYYSMVVHY